MELNEKKFLPKLRTGLFSLFSCFNSREVPSPANLKTLINSAARHEFLVKTLGTLYATNRSVPAEHKHFCQSMTVDSLTQVHEQCTPTMHC